MSEAGGRSELPARGALIAVAIAAFLALGWMVARPVAADDGASGFEPLTVGWPAGSQRPSATSDRVQFIIGGSPAAQDEFAFMVYVLTLDANGDFFQCGGTLIASDLVLTAAHCIDTAEAAAVVVGRTTAPTALDDADLVDATEKAIHPDYGTTDGVQGDIGLLRLEASVTTPVVALAHPDDAAFAAPGVAATVAGWGRTGPTEPPSDVLRAATMPVRTDAECRSGGDLNYSDATNICAGYRSDDGVDPTGACVGDSGGPLLVPTDDSRGRIQIGTVSYGPDTGCISLDQPVVYMRVSAYLDWIETLAGDLTGPPAPTTTTTTTSTIPATTTTTTTPATTTTTSDPTTTVTTATTTTTAVVSAAAAPTTTTTTVASASFAVSAQASSGGTGGTLASTGSSSSMTVTVIGWSIVTIILGRVTLLAARRPDVR